ncbi:ATP-binding cassette domain-containing protein [Hydrogenoanaerobacterium sp.]|uniref:ATP-binding cassette domain-containing protein n=1 Tax=Hydrogenoanaerobacterium sp. TaxID=2953763 RepID=UPI0028A112FE|nr:ATP-binding cassette domain-containing protein [Hydrogenoanaerobacterium sp.]
MKEEIIRLERVTQIVDGVTLLDNFNLHIFKGEIMGLLSINVHGQEALIRLLCQNVPIHYGHVYFQETLVNNYEHSSMSKNRVSVIEKQSRLVESLTVADNIFVLRDGFKKYLISPKMLDAQLRQFTEELDISIDVNQPVANLSFFQRYVVELLKAVVTGVKLVVIRDISNFISTTDLKKFHDLLRHYLKRGISFLYICNHHEEAFKICERVSLMENGKVFKVLNRNDFRDEMITPYTLDFSRIASPPIRETGKDGILRFQNISTQNIKNMSFTIEKGECVVFLDIDNTVLTDILQLMNDEQQPSSGDILLNGLHYSEKAARLKRSVGFIQENPTQSMLFKEMSYIDNLCFLMDRKKPNLWFSKNMKKSILREYEPLIGEDIYAADITSLTPLSLYNLAYYKIHLYNPKVVLCVQPFSGADMYLRHHLIGLISQLRRKGITVIILAVSLSDSLVVADRLMVIEQGQLRKEYHREELDFFNTN